ncbi:hypothetical protein ACET3Z_027068 [Daucus carota]
MGICKTLTPPIFSLFFSLRTLALYFFLNSFRSTGLNISPREARGELVGFSKRVRLNYFYCRKWLKEELELLL